jgi:hypothetical protein
MLQSRGSNQEDWCSPRGSENPTIPPRKTRRETRRETKPLERTLRDSSEIPDRSLKDFYVLDPLLIGWVQRNRVSGKRKLSPPLFLFDNCEAP